MSNDPLALPAVTAGPSDEADYGAVYAAVTATERGRWFLTEYASRNRRTDTESVVAALARIESAIRAGMEPAPVSRRELVEIAAAIRRIRATILLDSIPAAAISAAAERIQDIAFGLRERAVDSGLCDALDTAAREIHDTCKGSVANGEHAHEADELLRELAVRIDKMIQSAPASTGAAVSAGESRADDVTASRDGLFAADARENKRFAEAVTALAESLTSLTRESEAAPAPPRDRAETVTPPLHEKVAPSPEAAKTEQLPRSYIEPPDFVFQPAAQQEDQDGRNESAKAVEERPQLAAAPLLVGLANGSAVAFDLQPNRAVASPQPVPPAPPPAAATAEPVATAKASSPGIAGSSSSRDGSSVASGDPLAAIRALSADELIALFG